MAKHSVTIGHLSFPSKKEGAEHFRRIRNGHPVDERITGQDDLDLRAALEVHPNRDAKLAQQKVSHFEIRRFMYGRPAIFLIRADGSAIDMSVEKALGIRP